VKSYKVVIFIFSVIAMLAVLCAFFPEEGVNVGKAHLGFCQIDEFLPKLGEAKDTLESSETPEELLARRIVELRNAEESQYLDYFTNSDARIEFPDNDFTLFDPFFAALDSAMVHPVRVVHYGDSQLEEDRISNNLRAALQERFGGNGIGMVPLIQNYPTLTSKQTRSSSPRRALIYGTRDFSVQQGRWGAIGQVARVETPMSFTYYPAKKLDTTSTQRYYQKVTLLTDTLRAPMTMKVNGVEGVCDTLHQPLRRISVELPALSEALTVNLSGAGDVFGVMYDGLAGVSLDNAAMRGNSGTSFTQMNAGQLADYFNNFNVKLIILQYGGNATPYLQGAKSRETYAAKLEKQMALLKSLAPDACFLFIGPSDMSTNVNGSMQTYPHLPAVIDILRSTSHKYGIAYWNLYQVMGGHNSMAKWVHSTPPLAGRDYIHFTHRGADRVGDFLSESLMLYYDYYKWRNKSLEEQVLDALGNRSTTNTSTAE